MAVRHCSSSDTWSLAAAAAASHRRGCLLCNTVLVGLDLVQSEGGMAAAAAGGPLPDLVKLVCVQQQHVHYDSAVRC
jgi:hypothetical protein